MEQKTIELRESLILISVIIIVLGLSSAIFIYATAGNDEDNVSGYEIIGGDVYPLHPEDTRVYRRDLQLFGGKSALVVNDFSRWFVGLWHGKKLAFTIAGISIFMSLVIFFLANRLPFLLKSDTRRETNRK